MRKILFFKCEIVNIFVTLHDKVFNFLNSIMVKILTFESVFKSFIDLETTQS